MQVGLEGLNSASQQQILDLVAAYRHLINIEECARPLEGLHSMRECSRPLDNTRHIDSMGECSHQWRIGGERSQQVSTTCDHKARAGDEYSVPDVVKQAESAALRTLPDLIGACVATKQRHFSINRQSNCTSVEHLDSSEIPDRLVDDLTPETKSGDWKSVGRQLSLISDNFKLSQPINQSTNLDNQPTLFHNESFGSVSSFAVTILTNTLVYYCIHKLKNIIL